MNTGVYLPSAAIASYVRSILVIENYSDKRDFILPLYANGYPALIFQTVKAANAKHIGHVSLYGQTINPEKLIFDTGFTLIAYFLHPYALFLLSGIPANELTGHIIDTAFMSQARTANLQEQLLNANSLTARLQLINDFISALIAGQRQLANHAMIAAATRQLKDNNNARSLTTLQRELNITERSLQRLFLSNVGVSPRMYQRICQFHAAFNEVNQPRPGLLTEIAYRHTFADQSHFIRVFKEFTHLTPKEYLAARALYSPS